MATKLSCVVLISLTSLLFLAPGVSSSQISPGAIQVQSAGSYVIPTEDGPAGCPTLWESGGASNGAQFGYAVAVIGDVNQDGKADYLVGSPGESSATVSYGSATLYSGKDGAVIHQFFGGELDRFGYAVAAAGDVNKDGVPDMVIGAPGVWSMPGSARVISGSTGAVLYSFFGDSNGDQFGCSVSGAGDFNGDGYADVIVGAYRDGHNGLAESGSATVFSGKTGAILRVFDGAGSKDWFGIAVGYAGDVNKDGFGDVIVGADQPLASNKAGYAKIFAGNYGALLFSFSGVATGDRFGNAVSGVGDVNADGWPDVAVGAYQNDTFDVDGGMVRVFSGKTGAILYTLHGESDGDWYGKSLSPAGDVDHDGRPDILVGAPSTGPDGYVRVISGATGLSLGTIYDFHSELDFGYSVSGGSDTNGDGDSDFLVGNPAAVINAVAVGSTRLFPGPVCADAPPGNPDPTVVVVTTGRTAGVGAAVAVKKPKPGNMGPPPGIQGLLQHHEAIFHTLFPGSPYEWAKFPYWLNQVVTGPGTYSGMTAYGPFTLTVATSKALPVSTIPDPITKQFFMDYGLQMVTIEGALSNANGSVAVWGTALAQTIPAGPILSKFLVGDYLTQSLSAKAAQVGCPTNADDWDCYIPPDVCGPDCSDPDAVNPKTIEPSCADGACHDYKNAMADSCQDYNDKVEQADLELQHDLDDAWSDYCWTLGGCVAVDGVIGGIVSFFTGGFAAPAAVAVAAACVTAAEAKFVVDNDDCYDKYNDKIDLFSKQKQKAQKKAKDNLLNDLKDCCEACPQ